MGNAPSALATGTLQADGEISAMRAALAVGRLGLAEKLSLSGRLRHLDGRLFDGDGHVRPGIDERRADSLLAEINEIRRALGFIPIDRNHQHSWEADGRQA